MYKLCAKIVPHSVDTAQTTKAVSVTEQSSNIKSHSAADLFSDGIQRHQSAAEDNEALSAVITQPSVIEDSADSTIHIFSFSDDLNADRVNKDNTTITDNKDFMQDWTSFNEELENYLCQSSEADNLLNALTDCTSEVSDTVSQSQYSMLTVSVTETKLFKIKTSQAIKWQNSMSSSDTAETSLQAMSVLSNASHFHSLLKQDLISFSHINYHCSYNAMIKMFENDTQLNLSSIKITNVIHEEDHLVWEDVVKYLSEQLLFWQKSNLWRSSVMIMLNRRNFIAASLIMILRYTINLNTQLSHNLLQLRMTQILLHYWHDLLLLKIDKD